MKFTIDLEEKKILIHDSFSRKELDQLFSLLNIENMDEFVIDKYEENTLTNPIPNQPINPYNPYPDWTVPAQPYYYTITDNTDTITLNNNITTTDNTGTTTLNNNTTTTSGQLLCNELD